MNTSNKKARIGGILFLIAMITYSLGNQFLLGPIMNTSNLLTNVYANSTLVVITIFLELISGIAAVSIGVMLFSVIAHHNKDMAFGYLSFMIIGFTIIVVGKISLLSLLTLSQEYVKAGPSENADYFQTLGILIRKGHYWAHLMFMITSSLGASIFYYLLYQSKLVPRFISVWGLIGSALALIAVSLTLFDYGTILILYLPRGLAQLILAVWLIVKGFNLSAAPQPSVKSRVE